MKLPYDSKKCDRWNCLSRTGTTQKWTIELRIPSYYFDREGRKQRIDEAKIRETLETLQFLLETHGCMVRMRLE